MNAVFGGRLETSVHSKYKQIQGFMLAQNIVCYYSSTTSENVFALINFKNEYEIQAFAHPKKIFDLRCSKKLCARLEKYIQSYLYSSVGQKVSVSMYGVI